MFKLYGDATGNCIRAAIALEEAEVSYVPVLVDLRRREQKEAGYLAMNPEGKVPTLVAGTTDAPMVISQSNAIVMYAADLSQGRLLPSGNAESRALIYQRFFYFLTEVVENLQSTIYIRSPGGNEATRILTDRALSALVFAERYVGESRFMAGDRFSIADIPALSVLPALVRHLDWDSLPNLARWFKEVSTRPAVLRGFNAFEID